MAKRDESKLEVNSTHFPSGFMPLDYMLGANHRNLNGDIIDVVRGFTVGKQYAICALPGAGKSTLIPDILSFPLHIGMKDCVHKIIIIDTDGAEWSPQRLRKITSLDLDTIDEKFQVYSVSTIEETISILAKEEKEYKAMKYKQVKFFDPYMGIERKCVPIVYIVFDTITSFTSTSFEEGDKMIAKQQSMTTFLDVGNLVNNIPNMFDGNSVVLYSTHLKPNNPPVGQRLATKEFKTAPGNWKSHLPIRVKQKASAIFWFTKTKDGNNFDSTDHPIHTFGLADLKTTSAFITDCISVKSRTGSEGRTITKLFFLDGKFNRELTNLATALNLGIIKTKGGNHPTADNPSIFKGKIGCEDELAAQGRRSKSALVVKGFNYITNIIELRLILNYLGDNEEMMAIKGELQCALNDAYESTLSYELEANNMTSEDFKTSQAKIQSILGFITRPKSKSTEAIVAEREEHMPDKIDVNGIDLLED